MKHKPTFRPDWNESFPHLAEAPIVEAVIHWRARASVGFDPTSLPQLRERLTDRLPGYPECRPQHHLELEAQFAGGTASHAQRQTWEGFRLTSADERNIVQFTRDGVVVSRLTPYEDWDSFASEASQAWQAFVELATPAEVQRLGVRYINRINLASPNEARSYLANPPECLEPLGLPARQFLHQSLHDVPGHPYQINVTQTLQIPSLPKTSEWGLIVDIDVGTTQVIAVDTIGLDRCLTQMHWLKNKAFFSLLSEKAVQSLRGGRS